MCSCIISLAGHCGTEGYSVLFFLNIEQRTHLLIHWPKGWHTVVFQHNCLKALNMKAMFYNMTDLKPLKCNLLQLQLKFFKMKTIQWKIMRNSIYTKIKMERRYWAKHLPHLSIVISHAKSYCILWYQLLWYQFWYWFFTLNMHLYKVRNKWDPDYWFGQTYLISFQWVNQGRFRWISFVLVSLLVIGRYLLDFENAHFWNLSILRIRTVVTRKYPVRGYILCVLTHTTN